MYLSIYLIIYLYICIFCICGLLAIDLSTAIGVATRAACPCHDLVGFSQGFPEAELKGCSWQCLRPHGYDALNKTPLVFETLHLKNNALNNTSTIVTSQWSDGAPSSDPTELILHVRVLPAQPQGMSVVVIVPAGSTAIPRGEHGGSGGTRATTTTGTIGTIGTTGTRTNSNKSKQE